jgi:beta-hydroxylase
VHGVENVMNMPRLILFCDVERPLPQPMASLNRLIARTLMRATTTQNEEGERIGLINRIASPFLKVHSLMRKVKAADRHAYYRRKRAASATALALIGGAVIWVLLIA